ncbi:hypothetical protein Fcan01_03475 [Folsomia candida]|uniref:Uncharacterized protein n=2 Tax=Folsomia candida TaxID=158441 RepID=A0A226F2H9_FOLCA|nr:hypothetical protein Fcan01_03475 [Folsomia candida]
MVALLVGNCTSVSLEHSKIGNKSIQKAAHNETVRPENNCVGDERSCEESSESARSNTGGEYRYAVGEASHEEEDVLPISTSDGFKRVDFLWRKRLKDLEFLVLFLAVTGIPLLFTLAALILTESSTGFNGVRESTKSAVGGFGWGGGGVDGTTMAGWDEPPQDLIATKDKVAFTKDILRVASQSLNLASNTVDLFNTLRGSDISSGGGGDDGGGNGGRGEELAAGVNKVGVSNNASNTNEGDRRSSNIRFVSKLIQLSTTSIGFILQILNY